MCCFEQILEAALYKTAAVRPLISHLAKQRKKGEQDMLGTAGKSKDQFISDVLQWTHKHGHTSFGRSAKTCIHQLCVDSGYGLRNLPSAVTSRDEWRVEVKGIKGLSVRLDEWWCNPSSVSPCALLSISLFYSPYICIPPWFSLRRVQIIFQKEIALVRFCFYSVTLKYIFVKISGVCSIMVIVVGNGHKFKSWTRLFEFHIALILSGRMNPIILPPAIGK